MKRKIFKSKKHFKHYMFSILKTIIVGTRQMRAAKVFKISLKSGGEKVPASTNNRNEDR